MHTRKEAAQRPGSHTTQQSARRARPDTTEVDSAAGWTATRRKPVMPFGHRQSRLDRAGTLGEKYWRAGKAGDANRHFRGVTKQSDRADVVRLIGIAMQRGVQLRTDREQAHRPDRQCAQRRDPAKRCRVCSARTGGGGTHGAKAGRLLRDGKRQVLVFARREPQRRRHLPMPRDLDYGHPT
jgi:hypothetical protein